MEPLRLIPVCKDYLWGGTKLVTEYGKPFHGEKVAESWELSCHKDGESRVSGGVYDGLPLSAALEELGPSALGYHAAKFSFFPLLIKLIDAKDKLSIQVHPDDRYALKVEGEYGKTEMWLVVDCQEGAFLYYGLERPVTKEEFSRRITQGGLEELLHQVPVKKGDVFFIQAGTIHAIGAGILIAEIQQNSNTTYRVYDYGRVGADGKTRPLHVDKALDVANLCPAPPTPPPQTFPVPGGTQTLLASCPYFTVECLTVEGSMALNCGAESFQHLLVLEGAGCLRCPGGEEPLKKGDSLFLPAGLGEYTLEGSMQLVRSRV